MTTQLRMTIIRSGVYLSQDAQWRIQREKHAVVKWWNVWQWSDTTRTYEYIRSFRTLPLAREYVQRTMQGEIE